MTNADTTDDIPDAQEMAGRLSDEFLSLTPASRADQLAAREEPVNYIEKLWEGAKDRGLNPAALPEWNAVAGMLDLARFLHHNASEAISSDETE